MKRKILTMVASVGILLVLSVGSLHAQLPGTPGYRPPISPYLNLFRTGNPAINYYGIVRPEVEFRRAYQGLQQQVATQGQEIDQNAEQGVPSTGHTTQFMNFSHYYPGTGVGQGVRRSSNQSQLQATLRRPPVTTYTPRR